MISSWPRSSTTLARASSAPAIAWPHVVAGWFHVGGLIAAEGSAIAMRAAIARSRVHGERGAEVMAALRAPERAIELTRLHHRDPGANAMLALLQRADAAT